jgi:crotonobetainyl-CoA:carnitine CoA-transferase CaiB-like acyl-CoA transferase
MANLGLTSQRLLELNPRLAAVTMPGYGPGGPWGDYVGYAIPFEQMVVGSMNGYPNGSPTYAAGFCDPVAGMHAVAAIELALRQREDTGEGAIVEVPQCEILDSLFAPEQIAVQLGAPLPKRRGNKHEWMAPHDAYRVAGKDAWLTIAVATDDEFRALCDVLNLRELSADLRFATVDARKEHETDLDALIAEALRDREGEESERALQAVGVAACRIIKPYDLPDDANMRHIAFFEALRREATGVHNYKSWPFRFSGIDTTHKQPPPHLGEHNAEILQGVLGVARSELVRLKEQQVIGTEPLGLGPPAH